MKLKNCGCYLLQLKFMKNLKRDMPVATVAIILCVASYITASVSDKLLEY